VKIRADQKQQMDGENGKG
jgi:hypothetical protein